MKKQLFILLSLIALLVTAQVPQRFNKVIVTGDIVSPKFIRTGSTVDSILLGNGSARSVNSLKTDTINLSNRINAKATGNGTANGTNTGDETLTSIKTKLGAATSVSDGYLKYQDFVNFDGKLSSEVDGSVTNELQTISTTGAAGNITLSNSGGTLNLNVNDADASPTNEIQDLSLSGNTLTLSSDATTVDVSQATSVLANTAKVSNATHTGDVTGSTALTLATVNSNVGTFNNITINAKGLATAGSNVSYEPAITKNTAFNKNFGTTPGTVLEGRTFGTAANSAVGDFQPIENQRLSTANSPSFNKITSTVATGTAPLTVNSTTVVSNLNSDLLRGYSPEVFHRHLGYMSSNQDFNTIGIGISENIGSSSNNSPAGAYGTLNTLSTDSYYGWQTYMDYTGQLFNRSKQAAGWQPWRTIYDSGNLTNTLSTNYLPKWNGSRMVNSLISDDGAIINLKGNTGDVTQLIFNNYQGSAKNYAFIGQINGISNTGFSLRDVTNGVNSWYVDVNNNFAIPSTTQSTSPTTGALVVGGGIGVGGGIYSSNNIITDANVNGDVANFNEFVKSGGTSSQFLKANGSVDATSYQPSITLTTTGTSGAATFSGGVLNVPNYVGGSTGGTYSPTLVGVSNCSGLTTTNGMYTNVGGIITCTFFINLTTGSDGGSCELNIQLPSAATTTRITSIADRRGYPISAQASYYSSSYAAINVIYGSANTSYGFYMTITYK